MRRGTALLALAFLAAGTLAAWAQAPTLSPPGVRWGGGGIQTPNPTQIIGYDSGSGAACIIGSSATCVLATGAASAALPSGAATAAAQATTNSAISTTNTSLGATADEACATDAGTCSLTALLKRAAQRLTTLNTTLGTPFQAGGAVGFASQYPAGATPITAAATGTTGTVTATLAGTSGKTTYICGFTITADATALVIGTATVTGTVTGTLSYRQLVAAVAAGSGLLSPAFAPCVPASAANTGIAVNSIAAGLGGNTAVNAWGYQL